MPPTCSRRRASRWWRWRAKYHCLPVAIVLEPAGEDLPDRNRTRPDRDFGPHVIRQQAQQLRRSLRGLEREGFRHVYILDSRGESTPR